jgi:hypothetical protein
MQFVRTGVSLHNFQHGPAVQASHWHSLSVTAAQQPPSCLPQLPSTPLSSFVSAALTARCFFSATACIPLRRGPTLRECVLLHAVARLVLHPHITNIQASWVKMGPQAAGQLLAAGCNDMGGSIMNESITRAAGRAHIPVRPNALKSSLYMSVTPCQHHMWPVVYVSNQALTVRCQGPRDRNWGVR